MKSKKPLQGFVSMLTENKKLETIVCAALLSLIVIIFFVSRGISCDGGTGDKGVDTEQVFSGSELEERLERILSFIDGAGEIKVMITCKDDKDPMDDIMGVIVVAEGARDPRVKTELINAVITVLGTDPERVNVYLMNK